MPSRSADISKRQPGCVKFKCWQIDCQLWSRRMHGLACHVRGHEFVTFDQLFTGHPALLGVESIQPFVRKNETRDGYGPLFGPDRQRYDGSLSGWQFITCDIDQDSCHFPDYLSSRRKFRSLIVPDRAVTIVKVKKVSGHLLTLLEYFIMKCRPSKLFHSPILLGSHHFSAFARNRESRS